MDKKSKTLELDKAIKELGLISSGKWIELVSKARKSDVRKVYRITKAYLLATCETIGILKGNAKKGNSLKRMVRSDFTYEVFQKLVYEITPRDLEKVESGMSVEDAFEDIASEITNRVESV